MPILSANALCDQTLSTLTPSTSASSVSNCFMPFTKQACSLVHTGLQSNGYHTSTTFLFSAKSESLISFLSWLGSVKSGAVCPTAMLIIDPPVSLRFPANILPKPRASRQANRSQNPFFSSKAGLSLPCPCGTSPTAFFLSLLPGSTLCRGAFHER